MLDGEIVEDPEDDVETPKDQRISLKLVEVSVSVAMDNDFETIRLFDSQIIDIIHDLKDDLNTKWKDYISLLMKLA